MRARDNGGTPTRDDVQRLRAEASPSTAMEAALEDAEEEENDEHDEEESAEEEENDEESDEEDEDDDHDAKPPQSPVPPHALTAHPPRNLSSNPLLLLRFEYERGFRRRRLRRRRRRRTAAHGDDG